MRSVSFSVILCVARAVAFTTRSWADALALAQTTVANLTLDEKIGLVTGVGEFSGRCVGNTASIPRLNISSICMNDGPAGMRAVDLVSGFPAGISAAATFNRDLIQQRGKAIGEEFRAKGAHVFLGPAMDVMRAPEAGRLWESFGADPYLTGEAVYATVQGVQSTGVQACAKHLIGNSQETFRFTESSIIDQRTLHETYYLPFERAIDAGVTCVMCSYNQINGTYACENPTLIGETGLLKSQGGFQGYVVSDWGATHSTATSNANAGLDLEMPGSWILIGGGVYSAGIKNALNDGSVTIATVNKMATRVLTSYYRLGQDTGFPATNYNVQSSDNNQHVNARSDAHTTLIRTIGGASTVLLKNVNSALPLVAPKTMAVIGLDAANNSGCSLNACDDGTLSVGWGSGTNLLTYLASPITALQSKTAGVTTLVSSITDNQSAGSNAAKGADVAIVFVNADSGEYQPIPVNWSTGDRKDLLLWGYGDDLINAVASVNKNTVVVIHSVGPNIMEAWIDHPNVTAVVMAGLPGEQSGPSIVDVLYGVVNPSGRLPYTIAKSSDEYPAHALRFDLDLTPDITYSEGLFTDYKYFDAYNITPRYEFGFGLSYSFSVTYSNLAISSSSSSTSITATVRNTGTKAGTEIAQLYLGYPPGAGEPPKVLRGFEAVPLSAGAQSTITFTLSAKDISVWSSPAGTWVRPSGTFTVYVGSSSRDIRLTGTF